MTEYQMHTDIYGEGCVIIKNYDGEKALCPLLEP